MDEDERALAAEYGVPIATVRQCRHDAAAVLNRLDAEFPGWRALYGQEAAEALREAGAGPNEAFLRGWLMAKYSTPRTKNSLTIH